MILRVERRWKKSGYTIGVLSIDGLRECETLEDEDRGLWQGMDVEKLRRIKVKGKTAIPSGRYRVVLDIYSQKFGAKPWYRNLCKGYLPRLIGVPGYDGVLIHVGARPEHTEGCILVGENKVKGGLVNSQATFERIYKKLKDKWDAGEDIWVEVG